MRVSKVGCTHCDPTASHYLKLVLDAIFCSQGGDFRNEITWKRTTTHNDAKQGAKQFGRVHDVVFFYVKSSKWTFNSVYQDYSESYLSSTYNKTDPDGRRFKASDLSAAKPGGDTSYLWKGNQPPSGRYWAFSRENMEKFEAAGKIYYSRTGKPYLKQYLDEMLGVSPNDIWIEFPGITIKSERLGYPTQKPLALLERIIKSSSKVGDVVLDAYCGCGTTVAVSQRLKRQWIGIDITYQSISLILKRLEDAFGAGVLDSVALNGIPKDMASAKALALKKDDRTRKEFEKWAVLTYSNNWATINQKKGADKGIDGIAYFTGDRDEPEKIILQVKSGKVNFRDIRDLRGTMDREGAVLGVFITLNQPTKDMNKEAEEAGIYQSRFMNKPTDKIRIVTIQEMIEEQKYLDIRLSLEVLKSAEKQVIFPQLPMDLE